MICICLIHTHSHLGSTNWTQWVKITTTITATTIIILKRTLRWEENVFGRIGERNGSGYLQDTFYTCMKFQKINVKNRDTSKIIGLNYMDNLQHDQKV